MRPFAILIRSVALACLAWSTLSPAIAVSPDLPPEIRPDVGPCLAASAAVEDDNVIALCGVVIDADKAAKLDRIKALVARSAAWQRKDMVDRAIADYDSVLLIDPALADVLNARGELWRRKGDRPKALADFGAALKLRPDHPAAKANYKSMAQELERIGAQMAVAGKPSFDCRTARRAVEKAICADPALADLDRDIHLSAIRAIREARSSKEARALQREQDEFIARRNAAFGRSGYDLKKAMQERLQRLNGVDGY